MLPIRTYRAEELAPILRRGVETALAQVVPRELPGATVGGVTAQLHRMYQFTLQNPEATILVADWPPGLGSPSGPAKEGPAAYLLLLPQPNAFTGEPELMIMDIYTDPALRGRGVARELLAAAAQYGRQVGCRSLVAQVALQNRSSLRLFLGDGFQAERLVLGRRL